MYGLIKMHKVRNPVKLITSGCCLATENLSFFVEKCLYSKVLNTKSRVKDTSEMLTSIDNLNKSNTLTSNCRLISFTIANMFPNLDNTWVKSS